MATSKPWVVNASPLILLGKIGRLDLLESFRASIVVPSSVIREIAVGSDDDPETETTLAWATTHAVADIPLPSAVAHWDLGAGESQVQAHCLADGGVAVLDDGEARACARADEEYRQGYAHQTPQPQAPAAAPRVGAPRPASWRIWTRRASASCATIRGVAGCTFRLPLAPGASRRGPSERRAALGKPHRGRVICHKREPKKCAACRASGLIFQRGIK
jgi:hypothetical protein